MGLQEIIGTLFSLPAGADPELIDKCSAMINESVKTGVYAVSYIVYLIVVKVILAASETPDSFKHPIISKLYKLLEVSVGVLGKAKK